MESEPVPPDPIAPEPVVAPRRAILRPMLIGAGTTAALLLVASIFARAYLGSPFEWFDNKGDGKYSCYFNGGWRQSPHCPRPGYPGPAEAAVYAVVVDSLYYGFDRATAPRRGSGLFGSEQNPLLLAASAPPADALPGADELPTLLERELAGSADSLLAQYRRANARATRHQIVPTIAPRQELLDSAAATRFLTSTYDLTDRHAAAEQANYAGAPGVLTLSRAGIDSAQSLALLFAGLRVPGDSEGHFRATEYVILRKGEKGWVLWKEIPLSQ